MSETQATIDDARQAAATEPSATETQTAPATQPANDPAPGAEPTPPTNDKPDDAHHKAALDARDRAIRAYAMEQRETRRQLAAAREQLERVQPRDPNAPPSQAEFDRLVEQRAAAVLEARQNQQKSEAWIAKGNAEFADFTERCNELAALGAGENPAFMAAVGRLPDGHKLIAELASNPAEATRVLQLPPVDLAIELSTMAHRIAAAPPPAPKPTTRAPEPIRPLATAARAEPRLENLDGDDFLQAWNKRNRSK